MSFPKTLGLSTAEIYIIEIIATRHGADAAGRETRAVIAIRPLILDIVEGQVPGGGQLI